MKYFVIMLALLVGSENAMADANCWCRISINDLTGQSSSSGLIDGKYGSPVGSSFTGVFQQSDANQRTCGTRCSDKAATENSAAIAASACAMGAPNGRVIRAYAAVGTRKYDAARTFGTIQRANAVYNCPQGGSLQGLECVATASITQTCPAGWAANATNVDGGVTADGRCKKAVSGCNLPNPAPANGTNIGTYGFTWGNSVVVWGTSANGGAAVASCPAGFTISGNICRKAYPANLVSAAYCRF